MMRLGRIILNSLTCLALILCSVVVVLWVRSYRHIDSIMCRRFDLSSWLGGLHIYVLNDSQMGQLEVSTTAIPASTTWDGSQYASPSLRRFGGFLLVQDQLRFSGSVFLIGPPITYTAVRIPAWFVLILLTILPLAWIVRRYTTQRRVRLGLCPVCSYDLRATPDRCPECGTAVVLGRMNQAAVRKD